MRTIVCILLVLITHLDTQAQSVLRRSNSSGGSTAPAKTIIPGAMTFDNNNAAPLHRALKAVTDLMVHDIFSPPVASRIYLYTNVAAYEVLANAYPQQYSSLHGQVTGFPLIPPPVTRVSPSLASVYALLLVSKKLVFSEPVMEDSIRQILQWYKDNKISSTVYDASLQYGHQVSDSIISWADKDQYKETRKLRRYRFMKQDGKWIPTPPSYMAAVEPYWNRIRPVVMDSSSQFRQPLPTAFSKDSSSQFYREALDVYKTVNNLTEEQKAMANFWDCNPFAVTTEGHLNYATKKISPGGHWMSIVEIIARQKNLPIMDAAAVYTITSIAIFDAIISCWDEKYRSNVIRPETYIDANINEGWRPLLQTPPFPEYTSGHSMISAAAAEVLTAVMGDSFAFDDSSEIEFGLPVRHFASFKAASEEAAISRLYGGIHYRPAIANGLIAGRQIGDRVLATIKLKRKG